MFICVQYCIEYAFHIGHFPMKCDFLGLHTGFDLIQMRGFMIPVYLINRQIPQNLCKDHFLSLGLSPMWVSFRIRCFLNQLAFLELSSFIHQVVQSHPHELHFPKHFWNSNAAELSAAVWNKTTVVWAELLNFEVTVCTANVPKSKLSIARQDQVHAHTHWG